MNNEARLFYITEIMKVLEGIDNEGCLEYLRTFIMLYSERWGCHC